MLAPAAHALARRQSVPFVEALSHDFVALGRATSLTRQVSAAVEQAGLTLRIRIMVRSFDAMCRMVGAGLGIAPRTGAAPHLASVALKLLRVEGMSTRRRLLLAMRERASLSAPAAAFVDRVQQHAAHRA